MFQRSLCVLGLFLSACSGPSRIDLIDKVAPTLKSSSPSDGELGVLPTTLFSVEFSEKMNTDSVTIASTPSVLMGPPSWDFGDQVVSFPPASTLQPSTQYFFTVNGTDVSGNALVSKTITFTTASSAEACQSVACDPSKASQCVNGECRCGDLSACTGNQTCVFENNVYNCQAPAAVCSPPCQANVCCGEGNRCISSPQEAFNKCGTACADCSAYGNRVDSCSQGVCGCGTGSACAVGQRCANARCVCDATSCPDGCCTNSGVCIPYAEQTLSRCNRQGALCQDFTGRANSCASGEPRCNMAPACANDQTCTAQGCNALACDIQTCPNGCCNGQLASDCVTSRTPDVCGANGQNCENLQTRADSCGPLGGLCGQAPACIGFLEVCEQGECQCQNDFYCTNVDATGASMKTCCPQGMNKCLWDGSFNCATDQECVGLNPCSSGPGPQPLCCDSAQM